MKPPLVVVGDESDSGGIAARKGFRFQDHVAASLVIDMLTDITIAQVECETADDIAIQFGAGADVDIEYVQVKTTDGDSKWSITELTARKKGKALTSICERSLLCDKHGGSVRFRIVSTRDVRKDLRPFCKPWPDRILADPARTALATRVGKKWKTTKSQSGRTLADWAAAVFWQVEANEEALKSRNINRLLILAQGSGPVPAWTLITEAYDRLLKRVADMADASKSKPQLKCWGRASALDWWKEEVKSISTDASSSVKVYRAGTEAFFSELHVQIDEQERRSLHSYDAEYDGEIWRREDLIDYLIDWIPEVALPPSIVATYTHLAARRLSTRALKALQQQGITDGPMIIANLLLHSILRHHFDSEPIACKIYYRVGGEVRSTNAHIIQTSSGDQLWLGRSHLVSASTYAQVVEEAIKELESSLDPNLIKEDRDLIVRLREPNHLRPDGLGHALNEKGKVSDLMAVMKLPILIAYDSATLASGYEATYLAKLVDEVAKAYADLKSKLGANLQKVDVAIILVPVECSTTLASEFMLKLGAAKWTN
ncbi:dsDNA nuclease domain-containing protein [Methylobacterium sp. ARG-1]|uniref:HamA C-terminal domain-containing protein n=1 Tax=Methylobacterium sp. ARG-1 TaxID=1692501 RepID=UPI0009E741A2|nr:dsDNA nuclease domain-containing protein [Methylobacterium sp. ARG-1]